MRKEALGKEALRKAVAFGVMLALGAAPAALASKPDNPGGLHGNSGSSHAGGKGVTYVFKGTYEGSGSVSVDHGNAHVKKAHLVGTTVVFDLTNASVVVSDTNSDGSKTLDDVQSGDKVVVKARLPRKDPGNQPYSARQLVDQTHPAS